MAPGVDVARGVVLDDRYRLQDVIGQGGMATVYRAHDLVLARDVAIKLFPPVTEDADDLLRHRAEMRVLAQLSHPGLVTLHDAGSSYAGGPTQQTYLVMELVPGPTLAERLHRGPLPPAHTALLGRQVAEALAVVHAADVVHRDIKPANVLLVDPDGLTPEGTDDGVTGNATGPIVKLADFGIARLSDGARLTATGTTLGTATYLSPEQAAGGPVGPPTDVYALGLVLLECLTGRRAFTGTVVEVAAARLNTDPAVPADLGPAWTALLAAMTRRDPAARPTATEVTQHLTAILQGVTFDTAGAAGQSLPRGRRALRRPAVVPGWRLSRVRTGTATPAPGTSSPAGGDRQGTRVYTTAEIMAEADRFMEEASAGVSAEPRPDRRRPSIRAALVAAGVLVLLTAGAVWNGSATRSEASTEPPSYPLVDGSLGSALDELQRSVEP